MLGTTRARVTALVLVLLVGLAALGVAYGLWSKVLTVAGTVETGTVDGVWIPRQSFTNDPPGTIDPGYDKDVAECIVSAGATRDTINLTVHRGYPSYECDAAFKAHNAGTVPVKVVRVICLGPPEITCEPTDGVGSVLDPCEKKALNVSVHVEQSANQNSRYTCTCTLVLAQWNE